MSNINKIDLENEQVIFSDTKQQVFELPNITKLYQMYQAHQTDEIGERIAAILDMEVGALLVAEIMIDMTSERIIERLNTGEISKTMKHVNDYYVILESELEQVEKTYEGDFQSACFAKFPYGMVVQRSNFPNFANANAVNQLVNK